MTRRRPSYQTRTPRPRRVAEPTISTTMRLRRSVRESLEAVLPVVPHALELLAGQTGAHPTGHAGEGRGSAEEPDEGVVHQWLTGHAMREWVDVRAVKVTGSPPCRVGNRMTIVPGGQARRR